MITFEVPVKEQLLTIAFQTSWYFIFHVNLFTYTKHCIVDYNENNITGTFEIK